jgi:integrase
MGSITERRRKDGTTVYTAQVRIMRDGKKASISSTFERKAAAKSWITRKEMSVKTDGNLEGLKRSSKASADTLADAIDQYTAKSQKEIGKTKAQVLNSIKSYDIANLPCEDITSQKIVKFAEELLAGERKPQTVNNYLSHLSAVFQIAGPAWGMKLDPTQMKSAMVVCKSLGTITKSNKRERRPTVNEMNSIMLHFEDRHTNGRALPMHKVCAFAMFSTRRQEEITRLKWSDLDTDRILVRDMKHTGQKIGNDQWVELPDQAISVIQSMPKNKDRIFPYSTDAISASFTRACKFLGIEDLRFHDLRHEGVSRLFELGNTVPQTASVSGHKSWGSLQRYTHIRRSGDKWKDWEWLSKLQ